MSKSNDHTVRLKDGRILGYAEYGDTKGNPLFFFHGWPSSRLHAERLDEPAKKLKVRVISLDRPGYGLSDFQQNRKLIDFPDDVIELADLLGIKKFAIVGVSGGGPYSAVCAYKIPERITKAGIVVGLAPTYVSGLLDGIAWYNRLGWGNYHRFPFLRQISAFLGLLETKLFPTNISSYFLISKPDQKLTTESFRKATYKSRQECFRQGFKAASLDLKLYTDDWGFDLKKIKTPVYLWYGEADESVSLAMGKYYASQISNSKLTTYPKEGHYCQITHAEEILKTLVN